MYFIILKGKCARKCFKDILAQISLFEFIKLPSGFQSVTHKKYLINCNFRIAVKQKQSKGQ